MIKRKVVFKKNTLPKFVDQLKQLVREQQMELEQAVIGRGKYQFRQGFRFLEISDDVETQVRKNSSYSAQGRALKRWVVCHTCVLLEVDAEM